MLTRREKEQLKIPAMIFGSFIILGTIAMLFTAHPERWWIFLVLCSTSVIGLPIGIAIGRRYG